MLAQSAKELGEKLKENIKQATEEILFPNPDWSANTQISDTLNNFPQVGPDAIEAIKKRLGKSPAVGILTLTLLDYLVKNCPRLHQFVATEDFMKALVKLLDGGGKSIFKRRLSSNENLHRLELKDKTLVLIQTWGKEFARSKSFPIFTKVYRDLQQQGVQFPQPDKDETAPVFTPPPKAPKVNAPSSHNDSASYTDRDCRAAAENATVLFDLVTASTPGSDLTRDDLIQMMVKNCRASQQVAMARLQGQLNELVMGEILRVNEQLVAALAYYEGVLTGTMQRAKAQQPPPPSNRSEARAKEDSERKVLPAPGSKNSTLDLDLLGLNIRSGDPSESKAPSSSSSSSSSAPAPASPQVIPLLAPPPSDKVDKSAKKHKNKPSADGGVGSPANKPAASGGGSTLDLLDLNLLDMGPSQPAAAAPAPSPFFPPAPAAAPAAAASPSDKKKKPKKPVVEEEDEFMALATRDVQKS